MCTGPHAIASSVPRALCMKAEYRCCAAMASEAASGFPRERALRVILLASRSPHAEPQ